MKLQTTTTRRGLLTAALGLGLALGIGVRARAASNLASPFTPNAPWEGFLISDSSSFLTVKLAVGSQGTSGFLTVGSAPEIFVNLSYDSVADSVTISGQGVLITGQAEPSLNGAAALTASYTLNGDTGTIYLLREQNQGLITPIVIDVNVASLEIIPPDFLGQFVNNSGGVGQLRFQHDIVAPTRTLPRFNVVTGQLAFNSTSFRYVMTCTPFPARDGSFGFDLLGSTGRAGAPLLAMSGRFFPSTGRTLLDKMTGEFQLTTPRGTLTDSGRFAITEVR